MSMYVERHSLKHWATDQSFGIDMLGVCVWVYMVLALVLGPLCWDTLPDCITCAPTITLLRSYACITFTCEFD